MPLLTYSDFQELPDRPDERWLTLRDLLEDRLVSEVESQYGGGTMSQLDAQLEYASVLCEAAEELGMPNLIMPAASDIGENFSQFRATVAALAAKLALRTKRPKGLRLSVPVKERLHSEIQRLRDSVQGEELESQLKKRLHGLLELMDAEIEKDRFDYENFFKNVALASTIVANTTVALALAPDAISTITQVVGLQQEAQDEVDKSNASVGKSPIPQLPPPPKLIEGPK